MGKLSKLVVFVYGTLKVNGMFSGRFDYLREEVVPGEIKGRMYDVGYYPAIKLGDDKIVHGEVHTYKSGEHVEAMMDMIENYVPGSDNNLYEKRNVVVTTAGGDVDCIVYEFSGSVDDMNEIDSGIWEV